jgi:alkanesulfonate monooxygenase SsuD/methylene tetrahydromethanopterin reductase-like flavin-dependent oxidoreductase (luciferase family)
MTDRLKFGLYGLLRGDVDPGTLARRGQLAEQAGFESLWVGDHIALPGQDGEQPRLEVVVAVSYLAAVTATVRLGFGVIVLPQRQPVLLARQLSSIDILSRGRLMAGFGVGYVEPELRALGVPLAERGARTDEYLAAMRALWTDPGQAARALSELRQVAACCERPARLGDLEITITPPPGRVDAATARQYAELGVHRLVLQPVTEDGSDMEDLIQQVGQTLVGRV